MENTTALITGVAAVSVLSLHIYAHRTVMILCLPQEMKIS